MYIIYIIYIYKYNNSFLPRLPPAGKKFLEQIAGMAEDTEG